MNSMTDVKIIGAASGKGAQDPRCADGPEALREAGLTERLRDAGVKAVWEGTVLPLHDEEQVKVVADLCERLSGMVCKVASAGSLPVVLGGDHSCAIGTWSGIHRAIRDEGPLGLIWLDAHMDSHTLETSPSGALHGMPLACLLGHGLPSLVGIGGRVPKVLPQHVCLIGIRSFEPGEAELLRHLGVRVYFMEEIHRRGAGEVVAEALRIVQNGTAGFGISIDLDVLEPREEPGVGSPAPDGVMASDLISALRQARRHRALVGLEIAEYNPYRDRNHVTANRAVELLITMLSPREE